MRLWKPCPNRHIVPFKRASFVIMFDKKIINPNGSWYVHQEPVPPGPGRDENPERVPSWPEWMDDPAYRGPCTTSPGALGASRRRKRKFAPFAGFVR